MKTFARLLARALAAMGIVTWISLIEAGKMVRKAIRTVMAPPASQEDIADEEYARAVTRAAIDSLPEPLTLEAIRAEWGEAAKLVLHGVPCPEGTLDEAAIAYLQGLPRTQAGMLVSCPALRIGEHLSGDGLIPGLPRVPSLSEYYRTTTSAESLALHDAAQEALDRRHVTDVLEWLLDAQAVEPDPAHYDLPAYRPT